MRTRPGLGGIFLSARDLLPGPELDRLDSPEIKKLPFKSSTLRLTPMHEAQACS